MGRLVVGERGATMRTQLLENGPRPGDGDDEREADLAEDAIGNADDCYLSDAGILGQHALDLGGIDVVAAADVHVTLAADQRQVAVLVEKAGVARGEPALIVEHLCRALRITPVLPHHRARAAAHATDITCRTGAPFVVDHFELYVRTRPADRARDHPGRIAGIAAGRDRV